MSLFSDLSPMRGPQIPADALPELRQALGAKPLCGGCGSKLSSAGLARALSHLPRPSRPQVLLAAGDDAAVIREAADLRVTTTDHLRAFSHDAGLMTRITALHALSDLWAMGATPTEALVQVILPRMSDTKAAAELTEIMQAAAQIFSSAGVDILGGHSSTGAELTIGFTLTGRASRVVSKTGAMPGDALILTKPIGSGVIMAAEMAMARAPGLILGEAVAAAMAVMLQGSGGAARILAPHAHAMTDVTGFGLAGHLIQMLDGLDADLTEPPLIPGAAALALAGQGSSILSANMAATTGRIVCADPVLMELLHDPQTSGGLLAAVPTDQAASLMAELHKAGVEPALIGHLRPGTGQVVVS